MPPVVKKMPMFWLNLPGSPFRSRCPRKLSPGATDSSRSGNSIRLTRTGRKPSVWQPWCAWTGGWNGCRSGWWKPAGPWIWSGTTGLPAWPRWPAGGPGRATARPIGGKAEAAQAWVRFWEKLYQHPGSQPDGLFAATALLHLASIRPLPDAGTGNRPVPCAFPAQLLPPPLGDAPARKSGMPRPHAFQHP